MGAKGGGDLALRQYSPKKKEERIVEDYGVEMRRFGRGLLVLAPRVMSLLSSPPSLVVPPPRQPEQDTFLWSEVELSPTSGLNAQPMLCLPVHHGAAPNMKLHDLFGPGTLDPNP